MAEKQFAFGPCDLIGRRIDIAVPTPVKFGSCQEMSVEMGFSAKALHGEKLFPEDIGVSTGKLSGKMKQASISAVAWNQIAPGAAVSTGQPVVAINESGTIPSESTYTITVANAANFLEDLGVFNVTNGTRMTRVASNPATGEYAVDEETGIYTFAAADAGDSVQITYRHALATGKKLLITNPMAGDVPYFSVSGQRIHRGKTFNVKLFCVVATKLGFGFKSDDWVIPECDWEGCADENDNVMEIGTAA